MNEEEINSTINQIKNINIRPNSKMIADNILEVVGNTPLVRLGKHAQDNSAVANILLKMECMEPCGSVKDRIAKFMVEEAEKRGEIKPGETVLIEPTSGNTGIGLAMVAAAKGYQCIIVMPATMSLERRVMLKALGAKLVLTPGDKGMRGAIVKANELLAQYAGKGFILQQFQNPDNVKAHYESTGPEIWGQTAGQVDFFIAGVGTGGTLTGTGKYLKEKNPNCKIIAVEPLESAVLSGEAPGPHKIQGIGAGFVPQICDLSLIDEIIKVPSDEAITTSRAVAVKEGILAGISSGAVIAAALRIASRQENAGKNIVVILSSLGERYLSTVLFSDLHHEALNQHPEPVEC